MQVANMVHVTGKQYNNRANHKTFVKASNSYKGSGSTDAGQSAENKSGNTAFNTFAGS